MSNILTRAIACYTTTTPTPQQQQEQQEKKKETAPFGGVYGAFARQLGVEVHNSSDTTNSSSAVSGSNIAALVATRAIFQVCGPRFMDNKLSTRPLLSLFLDHLQTFKFTLKIWCGWNMRKEGGSASFALILEALRRLTANLRDFVLQDFLSADGIIDTEDITQTLSRLLLSSPMNYGRRSLALGEE